MTRGSSRRARTSLETSWRRQDGPARGHRSIWRQAFPACSPSGDVRSGNLKRVASAVGEGSTAIALVHQVLKE